MQHIALLDCNNFFVSCERLFRPDLLSKPVVVLSSNDGCVVARSKEIKDMGIPMGVPYFQIKDILKKEGATVFSSHFALYRDISRRVFEVVRENFPEMEQYSIDEAFFSFVSEDPVAIVSALKCEVERRVGIPVSVGVASSKTRAKYMNAVAKKTAGIAYFTEQKWQEELPLIKLRDIWGVGRGRAEAFSKHGILTAGNLLALAPSLVGQLFGVEGVRLQAELLGRSVLAVSSVRLVQKSVMSTRSFAKTTTTYAVVEDALRYHLAQCVSDLEKMDLLASGLRVLISPGRHSDYALQGAVEEVVLIAPTRDLFVLQRAVTTALQACFRADVPYKKAGIICTGLVSADRQTPSLFADSETKHADKTNDITKTLFSINAKYPKPLLQLGRTEVQGKAWQVRKELESPSYTTSWKEIKTVRS
jgi:DNA polymerase V